MFCAGVEDAPESATVKGERVEDITRRPRRAAGIVGQGVGDGVGTGVGSGVDPAHCITTRSIDVVFPLELVFVTLEYTVTTSELTQFARPNGDGSGYEINGPETRLDSIVTLNQLCWKPTVKISM